MSTTLAPTKERAETCSLDNYLVLPDNTMDARIAAARRELGDKVIVLGHHYQRDEVIRFADFRGDSYKLAQEGTRTDAKYIVFCGVHFMAESADVLAHEVDTAEDNVFRVRTRAFLGKFVGVTAKVGEANHFVALVVMAKNQSAGSEHTTRRRDTGVHGVVG